MEHSKKMFDYYVEKGGNFVGMNVTSIVERAVFGAPDKFVRVLFFIFIITQTLPIFTLRVLVRSLWESWWKGAEVKWSLRPSTLATHPLLCCHKEPQYVCVVCMCVVHVWCVVWGYEHVWTPKITCEFLFWLLLLLLFVCLFVSSHSPLRVYTTLPLAAIPGSR